MELVLKGEPKEIADFVQAIQNPPKVTVGSSLGTITGAVQQAIDDMLQEEQAQTPEAFDNIRAECARKHMSLAELTAQLGIERKTFYNWEAKGDLPVSALNKIADILAVPTDTILGLGKQS